MPNFKVIPVEPPGEAVEIAGQESAMAFKFAEDSHASILDVIRDEHYAFSLCRLGGVDGYWAMFRRSDAARGPRGGV